MADYVHELIHNRVERGYSTPAWTARFNEAIERMVQPAEQSDDPWGEIVYPTNEDLGVQ
jgi:hypothetical protein